jgi:hypothetical protein
MRRLRHPRGLAPVLLCAAALVAGCGGGDDDSDSTSSTTPAPTSTAAGAPAATDSSASSDEGLSKEEFIAEADEICTESDKEIQTAVVEKLGAATASTEDLTDMIATVYIPGREDQLEQIRALGTPAGDNGELEEVLSAFDEGIADLKANPVPEGNSGTLAEAVRLAKRYGFKACGQSPSA